MHELALPTPFSTPYAVEAEKRPGAHVTKVGVRIGALSGVEPEALSFGFSALVQGTDLEPLELVIEPVPRRQRCPACDFTFEVAEDNLACPRCASGETLLAGGDELDLAYLEVEE